MRNKHNFKVKVQCRCPQKECGVTFNKTINIEYVTNQRGDVVQQQAKVW